MDKKAINVEELIKELRLKHRSYVETCSPNAGQIIRLTPTVIPGEEETT